MSDTASPAAPSRRPLYIILGVIAALLVGTIIALFLVLGELQRQASNAAYRDCMARYGFTADAPIPNLSEDETDEWMDAIAAASTRCGRG